MQVHVDPAAQEAAGSVLAASSPDFWRVAGRVTGPLSEQVALSLDGVWSKRDGFMDLVDAAGKGSRA